MKRLCVFYKHAQRHTGNPRIEWIVCKPCQVKLKNGAQPAKLAIAATIAGLR